jgi:hypothetical protein
LPFTLSHAAAVLPAVRTDGTGRGRLVPAVLVAGSFSPDMTYYAASVVSGAMEFGTVTHSFPGVFTIDVLVAWALVGLWLLLREPLVALLPRGRRGRVATLLRCGAPRARVSAGLVARWYASAVLGALTHVVWDAFTHLDRWGMRLFPVLGREVAGSPLYWYLQYGGSALAAVVIAVFCGYALRRAPVAAEPRGVPVLSMRDRWWAVAVIGGGRVAAGLAVVGVLGLHGEALGTDPDPLLRRGRRPGARDTAVRRGGQAVAPGPGVRCRGRGRPPARSLTGSGVVMNTVMVGIGRDRGSRVRARAR